VTAHAQEEALRKKLFQLIVNHIRVSPLGERICGHANEACLFGQFGSHWQASEIAQDPTTIIDFEKLLTF
jgi:hypothetical protein